MVGDHNNILTQTDEAALRQNDTTKDCRVASIYAEKVNRALFTIAEAVNSTQDLTELYNTIHRALGSIIDVTNFYIAIVDNRQHTIFFPYHVDTGKDTFTPVKDFQTGSSLTGLVIAGKKPVLLRTESLIQRAVAGGIKGPLPLIWMGSPLLIRDEVIGVVAVQSYTAAEAYNETDLQLLTAISQQIATAIDRKRFLDELAKSEERYRGLVQNANSIIIRMDGNGLISFINEFAGRFFGFAADEIMGKNVVGTIVPAIDSAGNDMAAMIADIGVRPQLYTTNENENMRRDGSRVWVSWTNKLFYNATGEVTEILCVGNDITDRTQAMEAQNESEERYKQLMRLSLEPIYMFDPRTNHIVEANPAFEKILGYTASEISHLTIYDIIAHEHISIDCNTNKIMTMGATDIGDRMWRKKDGLVFPVHVTANKLKIKGNDIIFVTARDLTERKQAEAKKMELEAQNRQLQKTESLGRMAGAIAHHFNNKLQAVLGSLEMSMLDLARGERPQAMLKLAMEAAQQAAEVSVMMLTYLGQTSGKHEPIDLVEACRKSLILLQAACPKGISIKADLPPSGPAILANIGQVQQILTNILTNAWEANTARGAESEKQGSVSISIKIVSRQDIASTNRFPIDWQPQNIAYACLEVADSGHGIAKQDIENIFDPFFSTRFTGRGLGLPVALGLVGAHGGGITVQSDSGRGSVFRVYFPLSNQEPINPPSTSDEIPEHHRGGTVLVVDDEEQIRDIARVMLGHLGYKVLEARDGVEAVEMFHRHREMIVSVLCDLTMPRMDGWETLAVLRSLSPDLPVILSSGYNESVVFVGNHREQPQAFLHKPYQITALQKALAKMKNGLSCEDLK